MRVNTCVLTLVQTNKSCFTTFTFKSTKTEKVQKYLFVFSIIWVFIVLRIYNFWLGIKKVWYSYLFFQGIHCLHCANFDAFIYWILNCSPCLCEGSKLQFWISQFDWEPFNSTNYSYKFKWKFTRGDAHRHSIYIRTVISYTVTLVVCSSGQELTGSSVFAKRSTWIM